MAQRRAWGFSVIELMITIAVVAILVAIALPSFQQTMRSNRVSTAANEVITSFNLARSEALRNPRGAVMCTSQNGTSCGGDWTDGWIVWIDTDGDGTRDNEDRVVRQVGSRNNLSITASAPGGANFAKRIVFDNRGRVDNNDARVVTIRPEDCQSGAMQQTQINLSRTGQVRSTRQACP